MFVKYFRNKFFFRKNREKAHLFVAKNFFVKYFRNKIFFRKNWKNPLICGKKIFC